MDNEQSFYGQTTSQGEGTPQPVAQAPSSEVTPQVPEQAATPAQLQELEQRIMRQTQSLLDKGISSVNKKVAEAQANANKAILSMEQAGIPLTEQQKAAYKRTLIDQAYGQAPSEIASSPSVQTNLPEPDPIGSEVDKEIVSAMQAAGVTLLPEEMRPYTGLSPFAFVAKAKELIEAKRLSQAQSRIPSQVPTGTAPAGSDALRNDYLAQRKLIFEGKHPTIHRGDGAALSDLYHDYVQRGMKGQI